MARQARVSKAGRSRRKPSAQKGGSRGSPLKPWGVGVGLAGFALFGLAGCTAMIAGAAAGMLASRGSPTATVQTPTAGDSIDQAADTAGAALARTIKENVPPSVRAVPTGAPKVVTTAPPVNAAQPKPTAAPVIIKQTERIHDDINTEGASR